MNNKELVSDIANHTGMTVKEVTGLVSATVSAITTELADENSVSILGFGTFEVRKKLRMLVPPKMVVSFKPNTSFRLKVKN